MIDGTRHNIPLAAKDEAGAIAEVRELQRRPLARSADVWEDAVASYLLAGRGARKLSAATGETRGIVLLAIGKDLGLDTTRSLTPAVAERWRAQMQGKVDRGEISLNTMHDYLAHLRGFTKWCVGSGRMSQDPTGDIDLPPRRDNAREIFLETEEVALLLQAARRAGDRDMEFILALGAECGMRRGEIAACRKEWFDLKRACLTIPATDEKAKGEPAKGAWTRKGQEGRRRAVTIPLSDTMLELIAHHGLQEPYVVAPKKEWGKNRYRFEFAKRYRAFIAQHSPEKSVTIHDLRRSFGSNKVSAGVSLDKVANWLGIRRGTAEKRYARFVPIDPEINRGSVSALGVKTGAKVPEEEALASSGRGRAIDRLKELEEMYQAGLVSEEEKARKRASILDEL